MTAANNDAAERIGGRSAGYSEFIPTPAELREQALNYGEAANKSAAPRMKRAFASAAYVLAQLAECIERENTAE